MTPAEGAKRVRRVRSEFERAMMKGVRTELKAAREVLVAGYRESGVVHTVFGGNPEGLYRIVRVSISAKSLEGTEGSLQGKIRIKGLAALTEAGGRTKAHEIFPKQVRALAFSIGGARVFSRNVEHPGGRVPKNAQLSRETPRLHARTQQAGQRAIAEAAQKAGL